MMVKPPVWRLSLQTWIGLLALGIALYVLVIYGGLILEILWILLSAAIINLAIRPLAAALARRHIPRFVTVLGVYAAGIAVLALVGSLVGSVIQREVVHLQRHGPALLQAALSRLAATPLIGNSLPSINVLTQNLMTSLRTVLETLFSTVAGVGGLALDIVVVFVLAFLFATDENLGERIIATWVPGPHQTRARVIGDRLRVRLTHWVWAQIIIALYFAVVFSVGLSLLHVPFAFIIGLVGGLLEIVPYLGGVVAVTLALLSTLTVNPGLLLWVLLLYLVVVEVESHIVAPAFYGRVMQLHPGVALMALLIGARAFGVVGALFALPMAVIVAAVLGEVRGAWAAPEPEASSTVPAKEERGGRGGVQVTQDPA